jgi:hypothetical protein
MRVGRADARSRRTCDTIMPIRLLLLMPHGALAYTGELDAPELAKSSTVPSDQLLNSVPHSSSSSTSRRSRKQ